MDPGNYLACGQGDRGWCTPICIVFDIELRERANLYIVVGDGSLTSGFIVNTQFGTHVSDLDVLALDDEACVDEAAPSNRP